MDYGPFGVRFLFFNTKKERRSIDELLIYFATPPYPAFKKPENTFHIIQKSSLMYRYLFR